MHENRRRPDWDMVLAESLKDLGLREQNTTTVVKKITHLSQPGIVEMERVGLIRRGFALTQGRRPMTMNVVIRASYAQWMRGWWRYDWYKVSSGLARPDIMKKAYKAMKNHGSAWNSIDEEGERLFFGKKPRKSLGALKPMMFARMIDRGWDRKDISDTVFGLMMMNAVGNTGDRK